MVRSVLLILIGLAGAATLSQGPEFAQQYRQNLSGRVAELSNLVDGVRRDAAATGQTVEEALSQLSGAGGFGTLRAEDARATYARYERLTEHQQEISNAPPLLRLVALAQGYDREIADDTLAGFEPAAPITVEGGVHAAVGFVIGWLFGGAALGLLRSLFGRRREAY